MDRLLGANSDRLYAILRIVAGLLFAQHGAQKVLGLLGGMGGQGASAPLMSLMGLAGVIELFGGLLIAVGLIAPYVAFIASGEMAVAYFMAHAPQGPWPIQNRGELAILYCFLFLFVAARGSGIWSIDAVLSRQAPRRVPAGA